MSFIKVNQEGPIATLTVDRPTALNALNKEVLIELKEVVSKLDCRVLIITGAGPKAFVAGADIAVMSEMDGNQAREFVELGQSVIKAIDQGSFVSIAAVNGFALGGGCELAMACDLIYASENAKLGLPETNLGIIPGFGGTVNLVQRIGSHRALEMVLTGKMIDAQTAKSFGLVLEVFKAEELIPKVLEIAKAFSKKGKQSILAARSLVKGVGSELKDRAMLHEREKFAALFASGEPREGMKAFLEKREAKF